VYHLSQSVIRVQGGHWRLLAQKMPGPGISQGSGVKDVIFNSDSITHLLLSMTCERILKVIIWRCYGEEYSDANLLRRPYPVLILFYLQMLIVI